MCFATGRVLFCVGDNHSIQRIDLQHRNSRMGLAGHKRVVTSLSLASDDSMLVSTSRDETIRIWDTSTGKELKCLLGHESIVWEAVFTPDGTKVASASDDETVRLWDVKTGQQIHQFQGPLLSRYLSHKHFLPLKNYVWWEIREPSLHYAFWQDLWPYFCCLGRWDALFLVLSGFAKGF